MLKAFEYKLYPTEQQKVLLNKHFGCVRKIYNLALALKKNIWEKDKKNISCLDIKKLLPKWKKELIYLKEVNSLSLQQAVLNLDNAYKRFFKKQSGFPNFKSKNKNHFSFAVPQNTKIDFDNSKIYIPKFLEGIKVKLHRSFNGVVKSSTVKKNPSGDYLISILAEVESDYTPKENKNTEPIGIDLGLKEFLITSNDQREANPRFLKTSLKRLKRLSRKLSKTKKQSNNRDKRRVKLAILHQRVANQRKDFLHQVSAKLTDYNEVIVVETLKVKNMIKNRCLSRAIADVGWSKFVNFLEYKLKNKSGKLIKIDTFYPSSKTCNSCNHKNIDLILSDRIWICVNCNETLDRDLNAAKNIRDEGIRLSTAGTAEC